MVRKVEVRGYETARGTAHGYETARELRHHCAMVMAFACRC
jgi:hypothetical protein